MTNPKAPSRIWARIHGGGISHPSGKSYVQGGWEDRPRENAAEYIRADLVADAVEALEEAQEYFDNHADADCDQDGYIPNREMTLLTQVRDALARIGGAS